MDVTRILYSCMHSFIEQGIFHVTKSGLKTLLLHFGKIFTLILQISKYSLGLQGYGKSWGFPRVSERISAITEAPLQGWSTWRVCC